jgi:hypothetical protein
LPQQDQRQTPHQKNPFQLKKKFGRGMRCLVWRELYFLSAASGGFSGKIEDGNQFNEQAVFYGFNSRLGQFRFAWIGFHRGGYLSCEGQQ